MPIINRRNCRLIQGMAIILLALSCNVAANHGINPPCINNSSDSDGDGWGWENNHTCIVHTNTVNDEFPICFGTTPYCTEAYDSSGDGWGWTGAHSCVTDKNPLAQASCSSVSYTHLTLPTILLV